MHRFEVQVVREQALRMFGAAPNKGPTATARPKAAVAVWLCENAKALGLANAPSLDVESIDIMIRSTLSVGLWKKVRPVVQRLAQRRVVAPPSPLEKRLEWLRETLNVDESEAKILKLLVRASISPLVRSQTRALHENPDDDEVRIDVLATLKGLSHTRVRQYLSANAPLLALGLVEDRGGADFAASRTVLRVAGSSSANPKSLMALLVGKHRPAILAWNEFEHLGTGHHLVERLLLAALRKREKGINILLHGSQGAGKTEFARTVAERVGALPIFVGELDEVDGEPSRQDRVAALALVRSLAGRAGNTVLVVDEADDLFTGVDEDDGNKRTGSKVFMNRLVEHTDAPTIWITNHTGRLGPAILRRMAFALHFPEPSLAVRRRIVGRIAKRREVELSSPDTNALARVAAPPAIIDSAIRVLQLTNGDVGDATLAACSILRAMDRAVAPVSIEPGIEFDPNLSSADHDLAKLVQQVEQSGRPDVSFCLYGLPGTGKSAFARFLAGKLGLEVLEKRASDLLGSYVGETERAVAAAFTEAADTKCMLILDEADSLLRDRTGARNTWEVTQVNEMLTWMERHPYPFACSTNLMDSLDRATYRRFLFKVRFLPMTQAQARETFIRSFGVPPPKALDRISPLAPGDFAVISRRSKVTGEMSPDALVDALAAEVSLKGQAAMKLGFVP